ncbi:protein shisa-like-1a [Chanos chanos]|uniref:Protein shisa-like-1a n=1 Tax=Chanos chanos TaxID=29144 RepID=A0A6J2VIK0_CHACN|nr:protein shisa-like-1a [Chanos chanos]
MTVSNCQSLVAPVVVCLLLSTAAFSAHFRVCEPYADHKGRYHYGFHCPRLSDNKTHMFCCHHNNTAFKYCCNETEMQIVMQVNLTTNPESFAHSNYTALVGVWIYGFFVMVLLALDFVYYLAMRYELCQVYLEKWGLGRHWLKQARKQWNSAEPEEGELHMHPGNYDSQRPDQAQQHQSQARHSLRGDAQSTTVLAYHTSTTAW